MNMVRFKKILILLTITMCLISCTASKETAKSDLPTDIDSIYDIYQGAVDKNSEVESITSTNVIDMSLSVNQIGDLTLNEKTYTESNSLEEDPEMYIDYVSTIGGFMDEASSVTSYYKDGVFYMQVGDTKLKSIDHSSDGEGISDADSKQLITKDNIDSAKIEEKDGSTIITFVLKDNGTLAYLNTALSDYLTVKDLTVKSNSTVATIDADGYLISEISTFDVIFNLDGDASLETTMKLTSSTTNEKINATQVTALDNLDEYVDIETIDDMDAYMTTGDTSDDTKGETSAITLANRLVDWLDYTQESDTVYSYVFNDNETYRFDFGNNIFSYLNGNQNYSYNWVANIGVYNKCTYHYDDESTTGTCEDADVEKLEAAKDNFDVELMYCDITLDELINK